MHAKSRTIVRTVGLQTPVTNVLVVGSPQRSEGIASPSYNISIASIRLKLSCHDLQKARDLIFALLHGLLNIDLHPWSMSCAQFQGPCKNKNIDQHITHTHAFRFCFFGHQATPLSARALFGDPKNRSPRPLGLVNFNPVFSAAHPSWTILKSMGMPSPVGKQGV